MNNRATYARAALAICASVAAVLSLLYLPRAIGLVAFAAVLAVAVASTLLLFTKQGRHGMRKLWKAVGDFFWGI